MNIHIKYFGLIAEVTQCQEEWLEFSGITISELLKSVYIKYPELKEKNFQVAQNQELISDTSKVNGTEIAILPPFAGG